LYFKKLIPIISLAFLYFVFGHISMANTVENSIVTISPFFSEGFALAFVLIFGPFVIPGIFLGQLSLALSAHYQIVPSLLISISNSFEAFIGYIILIVLLNFDKRLKRLQDAYYLIITITFILQPLGSFMGSSILYHFNIITHAQYTQTIVSWYFGNILGQLLVTPLILYIYANRKKINYIKLLFISLLLGSLCYHFITTINIQSIPILFSITIIPLVLLLSLKNGLGYALFSVFIITQIAIYTFKHQIGVFSIYSEMDNIININFYILSNLLIVLVVGTLIIEKNEALKIYQKFNTQLEERVKKELEKNREKDKIMFLQSRMAQMGETIAMIAHQWRQPLNNLAILNQSLYLKYKKNTLDEKSIEKFFNSSRELITHMSKTIDDFKEFFKPDKEKDKFCLNETILHLLDLIKPEFDNLNIYIQRDCSTKVFLYGYKNEFSQAILNILNNAKDALVSNQILNKQIHINLGLDDKNIYLVIRDNAGGINPDIIDKIFDPYFSTKDDKNGTGLGLYMSKMIIEEHMNGEISVVNDEEGAIFIIKIPQNVKGGGILSSIFPF